MRFPAEQALYGALYARRTLEAGFTTVRNVGADDFVDVGLRNAINAGVTEGPRMLTAVHGIGSPGGHFDDYSFPPDRVQAVGSDRGHLQRPRRVPRGGALPDEVGCGCHQDRRERRACSPRPTRSTCPN